MIIGANPYSAAAALSQPNVQKENTNGQNIPGRASPEERIAKVGFKSYVREMQLEKLEEEARALALRKMRLTEEKLEKIGEVAPQKLVELEANIQEYITKHLEEQIRNELTREAQKQGKPGYRQGALMDISV